MNRLPKKLHTKLVSRQQENKLRVLPNPHRRVDFSSNDYLGFARSKALFEQTHEYLTTHHIYDNGATGSRLLSGNHKLYPQVEALVSDFHHVACSLIFNSGYDANVGFFSAVPQRGDLILYDALIHASIRDGIQMSLAKSYKFIHNDLEDLERRLRQAQPDITQAQSEPTAISPTEIYVVTESVFSMDGDQPDLLALVALCEQYNAYLIIDEAHTVGVFGKQGVGCIQELGLEDRVFARIVTFGKALGCHGAAILGSEALRTYLINFSRSFIYTTGLSPHALVTIQTAYTALHHTTAIVKLKERIELFTHIVGETKLKTLFIKSQSAIQSCILSGNDHVKAVATAVQQAGFDVKPILSPTVPKGKERLRFCLHAYNSDAEIVEVLQLLATFV